MSYNDFRIFLKIFIVVVLLPVSFPGYAQQSLNIGFENGTFSGWIGATGQCCPVYTPQPGINTSQYLITTGNITDPHSNGLISTVAPGSLFSARLGNDSGSAESERLDYSFTVPQDSLLLVLRFAVILENAHHPAIKQPRFRYEVTAPGFPAGACLAEQITAGDSTNDFIYIGAYELLDWQTRVINLTGMAGTIVNIHFETGDCEPGGHFGYAYVDGDFASSEITATICNPDGSITLYVTPVPGGTWFDGSTADSLVIAHPQAGDVYEYYIESEGGCFETLTFSTVGLLPESNFSFQTGCNTLVEFESLSIVKPGAATLWDFGDGLSSQDQDPLHDYNVFGTYEVTLTVQNPDNCRSEHSENITIYETPVADFSVEKICTGTAVHFVNSSTVSTGLTPQYEWYLDGSYFSSEPEPEYTFPEAGIYQLDLVVIANNCSNTSGKKVEALPAESCEETSHLWLPNAFTPNGDGINDYFGAVIPGKESCMITLFNRFGEVIYSGIQWDGIQNGLPCPEGIYTYQYSCEESIPSASHGTVMLIR